MTGALHILNFLIITAAIAFISCCGETQNVLTFWYWITWFVLEFRLLKRVVVLSLLLYFVLIFLWCFDTVGWAPEDKEKIIDHNKAIYTRLKKITLRLWLAAGKVNTTNAGCL